MNPIENSQTRSSGLAIASLILGCLALAFGALTGIPAVVLGIIAAVKISKSNGKLRGMGLAIAGIALPFLFLPVQLAILFPVFAKAREKARQAGCSSHMEELGRAVHMYTQEYDGALPPKAVWCEALGKYVRKPIIYQCPTVLSQRSGYAWSRSLPDSLAEIPSPGDTVMIFDATADWNTVGDSGIADPRHWNGLDVGFVDGHVKAFASFPQQSIGSAK